MDISPKLRSPLEDAFINLGLMAPTLFIPVAVSSIVVLGEPLHIAPTIMIIAAHILIILHVRSNSHTQSVLSYDLTKRIKSIGGFFALVMFMNVFIRAVPALRIAPHIKFVDIPYYLIIFVATSMLTLVMLKLEPTYRKLFRLEQISPRT
jgi:hypothetical protein